MISYLLFFSAVLYSVAGQCPAGQFYDGRWCCACDPITNCRQVTCNTRGRSTCSQCASGFILSGGSCIKNCASTQFWDRQSEQCCDCNQLPNCLDRTCSNRNSATCTRCQRGYTLSGGRCVSRPTCFAPQYYDENSNSCCDCAQIDKCADRSCSSRNAVTCHACRPGYVLVNNQCQTKRTCSGATFYDDDTNTCVNCNPIPNCDSRTCSNKNSVTCLDCADGYALRGGACVPVPRCGSGTFFDRRSNQCCECLSIPNCAERTCTDRNSATCQQCSRGYILLNNACVRIPTCPGYQYLNPSSTDCLDCPTIPNCDARSCNRPDNVRCSSCRDGYVLRNNVCYRVPNCSPGQYLDEDLNQCKPCTTIDKCKQEICSDGSSSTCRQCEDGYFYRNNVCQQIPNCRKGRYLDSQYRCRDCAPIPNCQQQVCRDATSSSCQQCDEGFTLRNTLCVPVPTCYDGQFLDGPLNECCACTPISNCDQISCTSRTSSVCNACSRGYVLSDKKCERVVTCNGATYKDDQSNTCLPCPDIAYCTSRSCQDVNSVTCSACLPGYVLRNNRCQPIPVCTDGQFLRVWANVCADCTPVDNCVSARCQNAQSTTCLTCAPNYFLQGGLCVQVPVCNSRQYLNLNTCVDCPFPSACADGTCTADSVTCTSCLPGFVMIEGACIPIPTCTSSQYLNVLRNTCIDCDSPANCLSFTCSGPSSVLCSTCAQGYVLRNGVCEQVPNCLLGTYLDRDLNACTDCVIPHYSNCAVATCTNAQSYTCTTCNAGYTLKDNICVYPPQCFSGTYLVELTCVDCPLPNHCATSVCTNGENVQCTSCQDNYSLEGNSCVPVCTSQQYKYSGACFNCPIPAGCAVVRCTSGDDSVCTQCYPGLVLSYGYCNAPSEPTSPPEPTPQYPYEPTPQYPSEPTPQYPSGPTPQYPSGPTPQSPYQTGFDAATETNSATESTTVTNGETTVTATSESGTSSEGLAIAIGVFAGVVVVLLVTLVVVVVVRSRQAEHI